MSSGLVVSLCGALEARTASGAKPIPGLKLQALLALLALSAPRPVSDGRLIAEVWQDDPLSNPANSLQAQVLILRRILGRDSVVRHGSAYALAVEPDDVDAQRVERLVEQAQRFARDDDPRSAAQAFQLAISLFDGPPLGDLVDFPFAREATARLDQLLVTAHEGLVDAELAMGRHADLTGRLERLVGEHPLRERFHVQLMCALYRCGRQADALRADRRARNVLIEELGIEPSPELQAMEQAVLSHDSSLDPPGVEARRTRRPGSVGPPGAVPFVGRDAELGELAADLDDALAGRLRVALLAGEPGVGKTRLAKELAAEAEHRGMSVTWGRCYQGRGAPAFWPWTQVIRDLAARVGDEAMVRAAGDTVTTLVKIVPDLVELGLEHDAAPPEDPASDQFRVCQSITRLLDRLGDERPLVVVLDDLHSADPSSLQVLSFLTAELLDVPLLVVGTLRDVGVPSAGALHETLSDLARQPVVRRVDVRGLDPAAVRELVAASGSVPTDDLVRALHRRTQGNPFFLVETLRLPAPGGQIDLSVVPTGVREVIRQRIALLPRETVGAIGAASVLGTDVDVQSLAAVMGGDTTSVLVQLEPAFAAGLLTVDTLTPGRCHFSHGLVRDTLYDDLGEAARPSWHQRTAEALESRYGSAAGAHLLAIADHWFRSVPVGPAHKGVTASLHASRWAQQSVAHQQAGELLQAALALLAEIPDAGQRAQLELEIQHQLSMLIVSTSGSVSPEVAGACARMRELCKSIDDITMLVPAMWRLAAFHSLGNDFESTVSVGDDLLAIAGSSGDPRALLAGHLTLGPAHTNRGDVASGRVHLDRALELCHAGHDHLVGGLMPESPQVWASTMSAWNWSLLDDAERAERDAANATRHAETIDSNGGRYAQSYAAWAATLVATLSRDVAATRRRAEDGISKAHGHRDAAVFVPLMSVHLGWAKALAGDFDSGATQLVDATCALPTTNTGSWSHVLSALLADAHATNGQFVETLYYADEGLQQITDRGARWYEPELHRLRAEGLAGLDAGSPAAAAACDVAIDGARSQGSLLLQRRAEATRSRLPAGDRSR